MTTQAGYEEQPLRLRNFHITFFAIILGMAGFTLAIQKGSGLFPVLEPANAWLLYFTLALFGLSVLSIW